jgi:hypothetical protein
MAIWNQLPAPHTFSRPFPIRPEMTRPSTTNGMLTIPDGRCPNSNRSILPATWALLRTISRKYSIMADIPHFAFGNHVGQRDRKSAVRTVSGMVKQIHPDGTCTREDMTEYLAFALEMRRRVKERLKHINPIEFSWVNLSYPDQETGDEYVSDYFTVIIAPSGRLIQYPFPGCNGSPGSRKSYLLEKPKMERSCSSFSGDVMQRLFPGKYRTHRHPYHQWLLHHHFHSLALRHHPCLHE